MRLDCKALICLVSRLRIRGARPPHSCSFIEYKGSKLFYLFCIEIFATAHLPDDDLTAINISRCVT